MVKDLGLGGPKLLPQPREVTFKHLEELARREVSWVYQGQVSLRLLSGWHLASLLEVGEDGLHAGVQRRIALPALGLRHLVLFVIPNVCRHLIAILLAIVYEGDLLSGRSGHVHLLELVAAVCALPDRH